MEFINILTNEVLNFNSLRDASRSMAALEGITIGAARSQIRTCINKDSLFREKYKIVKQNSK